MRKKTVQRMGITTALLVLLLSAVYVFLAIYYRDGFSYGTWINGIYCTGKTVEEVDRELLADYVYDGLEIVDKNGAVTGLNAEEVGLTFHFRTVLQEYLEQQNSWLWLFDLFSGRRREMKPETFLDEEKFRQAFVSLPFLEDAQTEGRDVTIVKTLAGYALINNRTGVLDERAAMEAVESALSALQDTVDLSQEGCYYDLPLTSQMQQTCSLWEKLERFQDCGIVYLFGAEQVAVDAPVVSDWVMEDDSGGFVLDENGNLMADTEKIREFIERLARKYDTVGGTRQFHPTRGGVVTVEGGNYGNKLDQKTEYDYLCRAFAEGVREVHLPEYTQKAGRQGKEDIGDTYIEIDMTAQHMYYYEQGVLKLDTPVVTGNTSRHMGTPTGVNYVYAKQRNRVLRGPGYASHVNYWMPVKGNVGIHDASWRKEYGGEIYRDGGSHGCINTPYDAMSALYDEVPVGTPVVMFY